MSIMSIRPPVKVIATLIVSLLVASWAFFNHQVHHAAWGVLDGIATGMSFAMVVLSFGAAWIFLDGIQHFKAVLQKAYRLLCVGIAFFGLAQVQFGLLIIVLGWTFWLDSGLIALPYLLFALFMFLAMQRFAGILDIRGRAASLGWAIAAAFAAAVLFAYLPHAYTADVTSYRVTVGLAIWDVVFVGFAAALTLIIKRTIGDAYARAMTWLFWSLVIIGIAGVHFAVVEMIMGPGNWYYDGSVTIMPFFVGALVMLRAGYEMAMVADAPVSLKQRTDGGEPSSEALLIDVVVYLASLASVPREIDPMLDTLRQVTSRASNRDHSLGDQDRQALVTVSKQLVDYLVTRERLRNFTPQELHTAVRREFNIKDKDPKVDAVFNWYNDGLD
jgi:hypothetical protein